MLVIKWISCYKSFYTVYPYVANLPCLQFLSEVLEEHLARLYFSKECYKCWRLIQFLKEKKRKIFIAFPLGAAPLAVISSCPQVVNTDFSLFW